ncbi:hypothetical protein JE959_001690 [Aeromonas veronii]|nr:hypothetical protein [Aeromonas veronii]
MKLPIPQLVIIEFEMAVSTALLPINNVLITFNLTPSDVGLALLKRIINATEHHNPLLTGSLLSSREIVEQVSPFCVDSDDLSLIADLLEKAYRGLSENVRHWILREMVSSGVEYTLSQLLVEPILPFQVFPVGGADNLEERIHKATDGSAAYDIIAQEDIVVTGEAQMIKLGFKTRMDYRNCAMLLPRSGHGAKWGFALVNTVGLIDSDYPGEWMAKIYLNDVPGVNDKKEPLLIPKGERLAQFLIVEPKQPEMVLVHDEAELRPTGRTGGFGSTNVHSQEQAG